ncbi:hypothetical protein ATY29_29060 [Rhizobium hidalgonense]|nr:hypothetical protein ATY29_29060 [Rhizobium hidalgonense]
MIRPVAYPGMLAPSKKLKLRPVLVENPFHSRAHPSDTTNPRDVVAMMNVRESAITTMAARGVLDSAQVAAATRFRVLWEAMDGKGTGAIDYGRERVDGGKARDQITRVRRRPSSSA